jgi:hypothetical protein
LVGFQEIFWLTRIFPPSDGCIPRFFRDPGGYNFMGFSAAAIFTILAAAKPPFGVPVIC